MIEGERGKYGPMSSVGSEVVKNARLFSSIAISSIFLRGGICGGGREREPNVVCGE